LAKLRAIIFVLGRDVLVREAFEEARFNKGLTSQDHAIGEVASAAPQAFGQGEFAVLLANLSASGEPCPALWNMNRRSTTWKRRGKNSDPQP